MDPDFRVDVNSSPKCTLSLHATVRSEPVAPIGIGSTVTLHSYHDYSATLHRSVLILCEPLLIARNYMQPRKGPRYHLNSLLIMNGVGMLSRTGKQRDMEATSSQRDPPVKNRTIYPAEQHEQASLICRCRRATGVGEDPP